jgi:hypothetical protein
MGEKIYAVWHDSVLEFFALLIGDWTFGDLMGLC